MPINPIELIQMIKNGSNPQQVMMAIMENGIKNSPNPVLSNLFQLAQDGRTEEIESVARNMFKEQGRDFDAEFNSFKKRMKL